jgi:hypothetical protein
MTWHEPKEKLPPLSKNNRYWKSSDLVPVMYLNEANELCKGEGELISFYTSGKPYWNVYMKPNDYASSMQVVAWFEMPAYTGVLA